MSEFLREAWRGKSSGGRYGLTIALVVFAFIVANVVTVVLLIGLGGEVPASGEMSPEAFGMSRLTFLMVVLSTFAVLGPALLLIVRFVLQRPAVSLVTPDHRLDWGRLWLSGGVWAALMAAMIGVGVVLDPDSAEFVFEPRAFLGLLLVAGIGITIQATTEELIFRGYFAQMTARWLKQGWLAILLPALGFAALHGANPEVASFGWKVMMPYYLGMGLLLGIVTLVDDRAEIAIGVHVANNLVGSLLVTFPESALQTPALIRLDSMDPGPGTLVVWYAMAAVFTALMVRRYGWTWADLRRALGRVEPPTDPDPTGDRPEESESGIGAGDGRQSEPAADSPEAAPAESSASSSEPSPKTAPE